MRPAEVRVLLRSVLSALSVTLACIAWAQDSAWQTACDNGQCRLGQAYLVDGALVSRVLIQKIDATEIVEIRLPLGMSQLAKIVAEVDGEQQFDIRIAVCRADGCVGILPNPAAAIAAFKRGRELKLKFLGFDDGKVYFYPFDLNGFTAAYTQYSAASAQGQ